jgi:hypothetical protein
MDASAFEPVVFTLRWNKISLLSGSPLPKGLPRDFRVVVIPHIFMDEVGQDVFVQTDLVSWRNKSSGQREAKTRHTLRSAKTQIRKYWEAWTTVRTYT